MYLCIDMKSFFASVECVLRGLDPMNVALAVVDDRRGDGALVMAATPKLKSYGVKSRCRLFEIPKDISFIRAKPRMKYYMLYAKKIHQIFLRYVSSDDCLVYSIDESFLKIDSYIVYYGITVKALAFRILEDIKNELGLYSTCGAGTNMYLSKIALDIMAKRDCFYFLDEKSFKNELLDHKPITDFWQIASGIGSHLERINIHTMRDILNANKNLLIKEFGPVLANELVLHANGGEDVNLSDVKEYTPECKSLSRSQVLFVDYKKEEAILPLLEMTYLLCIKMCDENIDARGLSFYVGYSKDISLATSKQITFDFRLRDYLLISKLLKEAYFSLVLDLPIRNIGISFFDIRKIENRQLNLFYMEDEKHIELSKMISNIHQRFGKNAILPGISLCEKSTMKYRNKCIGGHSGE